MRFILVLLVFVVALFGCEFSVSNIESTIYKSENIRIISYLSSDSIRSFDIDIFDKTDTFSYARLINKRGEIKQDGYYKNGKRMGPTNLYRNGKLVLRYIYKNDLPIFREDYIYNQRTGLLDSVGGSVIEKKISGVGDLSFTIGGISFKDGQIDTLRSRYYLFSKQLPFVRSGKSDITFKMDVFGMKEEENICMYIGRLDSTNINLERVFDTIYNTVPNVEFTQLLSDFIGVFEIEGNLFFCDNQKDICYNRIPFYLPVYFMKPAVYDELYKVLYKIPWNEPWK